MQAAIGVFLGDGNHQAQVRLDHFLLGDARLALAFLHGLHDAAIIVDRHADFLGDAGNILADQLDLALLALDETGPFLRQAGNILDPVRIELAAEIIVEKFLARHALAVGQPHQLALKAHQLLVDGIELFDQRLDAGVVDVHRLEIVDDGGLHPVILFLVLGREALAFHAALDQLFLQLAIGLEVVGDGVELRQHALAQFRFHGRHGHGRTIVFVLVILGLSVLGIFRLVLVFFLFFLGLRRRIFRAIGRLKVDQVTQQDALVHQLVAPDHHGFEGQRAFAQAADHGVAAGLDALGNGDLALAREQFHRAHLAQIHAHRIVGALTAAGIALLDRGLGLVGLGQRLGVIVDLVLGFHDIDPHFRQGRHGVLDLVRRQLVLRQDLVQFIMGHIPARLGFLDEFLDARIVHVEHRAVSVLGLLLVNFGFRHSSSPKPILPASKQRIVSNCVSSPAHQHIATHYGHTSICVWIPCAPMHTKPAGDVYRLKNSPGSLWPGPCHRVAGLGHAFGHRDQIGGVSAYFLPCVHGLSARQGQPSI